MWKPEISTLPTNRPESGLRPTLLGTAVNAVPKRRAGKPRVGSNHQVDPSASSLAADLRWNQEGSQVGYRLFFTPSFSVKPAGTFRAEACVPCRRTRSSEPKVSMICLDTHREALRGFFKPYSFKQVPKTATVDCE